MWQYVQKIQKLGKKLQRILRKCETWNFADLEIDFTNNKEDLAICAENSESDHFKNFKKM